MELWDVYDRDRNLTGRTMERGAAFQPGDFHLVVHICVFNQKGEMLIQQRQPFKDGYPGMWDVTVGGSSVAGENSRQAAERELAEEVGIHADFSNELPYLTVYFENGFDDVYMIRREIDPTTLKLQYEEVKQVKWATEGEIMEMLRSGEFIPYRPEFIRMLFGMFPHHSVHQKN